jgi:hypothetical protein
MGPGINPEATAVRSSSGRNRARLVIRSPAPDTFPVALQNPLGGSILPVPFLGPPSSVSCYLPIYESACVIATLNVFDSASKEDVAYISMESRGTQPGSVWQGIRRTRQRGPRLQSIYLYLAKRG